jgi:hypothetical protein
VCKLLVMEVVMEVVMEELTRINVDGLVVDVILMIISVCAHSRIGPSCLDLQPFTLHHHN